ncbi:hypothetical protein IscW_ISCW012799 [Ixodes scapularis]|uniref:Uncharacterized protein n=1 Tax=Ixodes scapularis TaxID=6945 RepID=B7QDK3_IXOSC|nr:hypothetical protein IscW_ISCW012799 [Ixodes scapularis]|eukprot:XP_002413617.1 hypothetical protein IscW_ISCW012799 [Ixodes scapularis]
MDARTTIATVAQNLSSISDRLNLSVFGSQSEADALFKPTRLTLDITANYLGFYTTFTVFLLLVLSVALVCYVIGLGCIVFANDSSFSCLITVGVLMFAITFLFPMVFATAALCRFSKCGEKDLSALSLIGKDVVLSLLKSFGEEGQQLAWLFDETKELPVDVAEKMDQVVRKLSSNSLDTLVPDLTPLEQKVMALNLSMLDVVDMKAKARI